MEEKKTRAGEGWYILVQSADGQMVEAAGRFDTLQTAEKALRDTATEYAGKTVLVAKIQRRVKIKVETVKKVTFE